LNFPSCIATVIDESNQNNIIVTLKEKPGSLMDVLKIFKDHSVNLSHIESRPSKLHRGCYDIFLEFAKGTDKNVVKRIQNMFMQKARYGISRKTTTKQNKLDGIPWFPTKMSDLDLFVWGDGAQLDSDHPGFTDEIYRARRQYFTDIALKYKYGEKIPKVQYTEEEIKTWRTVYNSLINLYPTHACAEFNRIFPLLQEYCEFGPDAIPQLQDISDFLREKTGFTIRPAAGLISSRDFLAGLAFRVFHSTQYIRHFSVPQYTPEPDICHEILGHVPLLADPEFASFSQQIGLISLGAFKIWRKYFYNQINFSFFYWFTVEFGICSQNGQRKAYGAGLLSSFGELQYALTNQPEIKDFDAEEITNTIYPITEFQPRYFLAESFVDAKRKLTSWAEISIRRPFNIRYDPYTREIEIQDLISSAEQFARNIKDEISKLEEMLTIFVHLL
uniref:phenylalanine 4-monooxygenase n=1 Tax=Dracunculus medinensis TaxID=318479 RepID=A0A158Q3K0_DRAME